MSKCIRCDKDTQWHSKICPSCLSKFANMRTICFNTLQEKYGNFSPETQPIIAKEMKRLEKIWRKNTNAFNNEITKLLSEVTNEKD